MGKYASIIVGAIVAVLGLLGFIRWMPHFMVMVKGTLPAMLIFGGTIAVIAGLSEMKDMAAAAKDPKKEPEKK
jgi:hypothetical protein